MTQIFIQIALALLIAFAVSYIVRFFKQPALLGYIIAGMIISPFIISSGISSETIQLFSEFGVAFLLFIVGLHLNPKIIREIGFPSMILGLVQVSLTFVFGFLISSALGFGFLSSVFIGTAISFSSTIVVVKLLSDENKTESLYGKISTGILIVQDLIAIIILIIISSLSKGQSITNVALQQIIYGAVLLFVLFLLGFFIVPRITNSAAKSQDLLFLFSICWCFAVAALFFYLGFSLEIGALIAGMILSVSKFSIEISSKIRPLRDFFLIIFFIILGLNIKITNGGIIFNAFIISFAVLILKPVIVMFIMKWMHYTKRTNFLTGITLAQISEFSLIILAIGVAKGYISQDILSTLTLAGVITIAVSTYGIIYGNKIYERLSPHLKIFETAKARKIHEEKLKKDFDAILFGYNRIGFGILNSLQKIKKNYLVVDFNPETISSLNKLEIPCVYGDVYDTDLLSELPIKNAKIIVSTIPDFEANYLLIESVRRVNKNAVIIVRAHQINEALNLYKKGASYVLTPHFLGGEYVSNMITNIKTEQIGYEKEREKHIKMLRDISSHGHEHPYIDRN